MWSGSWFSGWTSSCAKWVNAVITSIRSLRSIGLIRCASHPALMLSATAPSNAWAVSAMIGTRTLPFIPSQTRHKHHKIGRVDCGEWVALTAGGRVLGHKADWFGEGGVVARRARSASEPGAEVCGECLLEGGGGRRGVGIGRWFLGFGWLVGRGRPRCYCSPFRLRTF